jgi:hypothetical protein
MQFDEVVTFFHEFGHMMHEVLGGKQRWAGQSGVTTEGDFVEAPSQMLEEMFHNPTILQSFAKHYQTGETLPLELISRMNRASYFGRASWVQRQLFLSTYALQLHDQKPELVDFDKLLKDDYARFSPYQFVDGNRFYTSFTHLTGYSSNYYTYVLDKVIAVDFFAAFDPNNLLDGPAALRYRHTVLEPGSSKPAAQLVQDFLGRRENIEALKHWMDRELKPPCTRGPRCDLASAHCAPSDGRAYSSPPPADPGRSTGILEAVPGGRVLCLPNLRVVNAGIRNVTAHQSHQLGPLPGMGISRLEHADGSSSHTCQEPSRSLSDQDARIGPQAVSIGISRDYSYAAGNSGARSRLLESLRDRPR